MPTVFFENFAAGAPLFVPNDEVVDAGSFQADIEPCDNTLYPALAWGYAAEVYPGIGAGGGYGLWCPLLENDYWDMPDSFGACFALMGTGRRDKRRPVSMAFTRPYMWDVPPFGGDQALIPLACQTEINRIEFDFQLRSEAIFQYPGESMVVNVFYTDNWMGQGGSGFFVDLGPDAETIEDTTEYLWTLSLPYTTGTHWADGSISAAAMDIDGAHHHVMLEWQNSTVTFNEGLPVGATDGWVRLYCDGVLVVEMVDVEILHHSRPYASATLMETWMASRGSVALIYDNLEWGGTWESDLTTLELRGYENISGMTSGYRTLTAATLTSGFSRDFAEVQVDDLRAAMVMREPTNPAGSAWLELDFSIASSSLNPFFSVRDATGTPVLEFSRNGTTLSVSDTNGVLGSAAGVLVEGASTAYRLRWCFSSYVGGVAQADGYVYVDLMTYVGSPLWAWVPTALLSITSAVVEGNPANLPNYWSQIGFFPQGVLAGPRWLVLERVHPSWLNRPAVLTLGHWGGGGVYSNLRYSYGEVEVAGEWINIADWLNVPLNSASFVGGAATISCELWTDTPGATIQVRLWNGTDGVSCGESAVLTTTEPTRADFPVVLTSGIKTYRLQVTSGTPGAGMYCAGEGLVRA